MTHSKITDEIGKIVKQRIIIITSIIIDCLFLSLWAFAAWFFEKYVFTPLELKGVDKLTLQIVRDISGFATFLTVLQITIKDLWIAILKESLEMREAYLETREKLKSGKKKSP